MDVGNAAADVVDDNWAYTPSFPPFVYCARSSARGREEKEEEGVEEEEEGEFGFP